MDYINSIYYGFSIAFQPTNILFCFWGVLIGNLIGVLPGIGPVGAIAILFPFTIAIPPVTAIIMLSGIYYGAMYGGSTTAILVNIPGESASVMTCIDGYQMARQGRAGPALGISAFASFIAGTVAVVSLMVLSKPLASFALRFGPPEYFSLMCLGLSMVVYLTQGSIINGLIAGTAGFIISQIGMDAINAKARFTFGFPELEDGVGIIPVVMGLLGVSEIFVNVGKSMDVSIYETKIKNILPSFKDWMESKGAIIRGTIVGFFLGILPGGGAVISSFVSYALEKKLAKHPERFGKGAIEGVAGPEAANNSATAGAFIPLFTLGIPSNVVMALLLGALMIHGMQPGPLLLQEHPEIFWGTVASMYLGNGLLLALNLPLIGLWIQLLKIPYRILFPLILIFTIIGAYSANLSIFDVYLMLIFGIIGYLFKKFDFEPAPLVMAFILGSIMENAFRQSLIISCGSLSIFFTRPISATAVALGFLILISAVIPFLSNLKKKVEEAK